FVNLGTERRISPVRTSTTVSFGRAFAPFNQVQTAMTRFSRMATFSPRASQVPFVMNTLRKPLRAFTVSRDMWNRTRSNR
ncbi:hypothetical protein ACHAWF_001621, partial [Thalassiosira exigua]